MREMFEPGEGELCAKPQSVEVRIDRNHIYFAEFAAVAAGWMHLCPTECGHSVFAFVDTKTFRVEPWLLLALVQGGECPAALFFVISECAVVDVKPCALIGSDDERPRRDRSP